jgi:ribokinase
MRPRIAVVGSCNLDQMLSVAIAPGPGTTVSAADYFEEPGGKGLNQALAAARMGADVSFVGAVGDDDAGRLVRRVLLDSGVDVERLRQVDGHTGRAVIVVEETGDNRIVLVPGANGSVVSLDADDRAAVSGADALLLQLELPQQVAREAAFVAREADVLVALTPAPAQPIDEELLAATSILFANEHEMMALTRERDVTLGLRRLLDLVPTAVVTRGDRGSDYADRTGLSHHVDAAPVDPVDTTAAGDVYAGVFVTARCSGSSIPEAMRRATLAASVAVQRRGTSGSIPTAAELAAVLSGA